MKRFVILVVVAVLASAPAVVLRVIGLRPGPLMDAAVFGMAILGMAILAAGFLLSWSAEAAERHIAQGLVLAAVALITVLPEYAVDIYYAYQAGRAGVESQYVHYAAANMTGANRLLVGFAWPLLVFLHWLNERRQRVELILDGSFIIAGTLVWFQRRRVRKNVRGINSTRRSARDPFGLFRAPLEGCARAAT